MEKKTILVVDDDETILRSFREILQSEGYRVDIAYSGSEAIKKAGIQFYHLGLFDIKLPDMEGTELLTKVHKDTPKMMKIMITGYPSLDNAVESLNLGADAYILKPVHPKKLLDVVKEKLYEQDKAGRMDQESVKKWIETRVRKLRQDQ